MDIREDYQVWSISFFGKKKELGASINEELAQELHKTVIKKLKKSKTYARLKDNV